MKTHCTSSPRGQFRFVCALVVVASLVPSMFGQAQKQGRPASRVYVSDVSGEASIRTGETVEDLARRSVYTAEGTVIETRRPEGNDSSRHYSTMVYSNGTGAYFDADTRVEVRRFVQEPFQPNRTDVEVEPSISNMQAFVARGTVGLCTSRLVAGSVMTYQTPHGAVSVRGRRLVIQTNDDVTRISMLQGDSTVRAGAMDMGGHIIQEGEQAVIRPGGQGQPNRIEIVRIPDSERPRLEDQVAMACLARRTVYFEVRETDSTAGNGGANQTGAGRVNAFDSPTDSNRGRNGDQFLVPIEVVPTNLPVHFTVSPATLPPTTPQANPPPASGPGG